MDSAVVLAIARSEGFGCEALSFDYGQRHRYELDSARRVADSLGAHGHTLLPIDMRAIGGSALTDDIEDRLESTLQELQSKGRVVYSGRHGGYTLAERDGR